jgi:hypothetical protein
VAILSQEQILSLHAAVVSAHLTSGRDTLLGGIERAFADSLPICRDQSSQILSDLHALNAAGQLSDGSVPFVRWLRNALALAGPRSEANVFRDALSTAEAKDVATNSAPRTGAGLLAEASLVEPTLRLPSSSAPLGASDAVKPPFIGVPSESLGVGFKGREDMLQKLHEALMSCEHVALTNQASGAGRVYAHGGGGIGKSRLSIEYAWHYRSAFPGGVFYVLATTRGPLAIWAELGRELFGNVDPDTDDEAASRFGSWLRAPERGRSHESRRHRGRPCSPWYCREEERRSAPAPPR